MIVEQYRLILQHRIIDTDNVDMVHGKLEPDKVCEYNFDWDAMKAVPKSYIINELCGKMYDHVCKDGVE